jgi:hypothetical protein
MIAGALEDAFRKAVQQFVVFRPDAAKGLQGKLRLAPGVIKISGPSVLVECNQGGIVFGNDLPEPVGHDQFAVGKVSHDLADAPFARRGDEILLLAKDAGQHDREHFGAAAKSFHESR